LIDGRCENIWAIKKVREESAPARSRDCDENKSRAAKSVAAPKLVKVLNPFAPKEKNCSLLPLLPKVPLKGSKMLHCTLEYDMERGVLYKKRTAMSIGRFDGSPSPSSKEAKCILYE
jgi:hypothetical protein